MPFVLAQHIFRNDVSSTFLLSFPLPFLKIHIFHSKPEIRIRCLIFRFQALPERAWNPIFADPKCSKPKNSWPNPALLKRWKLPDLSNGQIFDKVNQFVYLRILLEQLLDIWEIFLHPLPKRPWLCSRMPTQQIQRLCISWECQALWKMLSTLWKVSWNKKWRIEFTYAIVGSNSKNCKIDLVFLYTD